MKQILLFLLLAPVAAMAQTNEPALKKIYAEGGIGSASGNGFSGSYGLTAVLKKDWTVGLMYYHVEKDPGNLPGDYQQGHFFLIPEPMPFVTTDFVALTAGKLFSLNRKTWLTTGAGVTVGSGEKMTFTRQPVQDLSLFLRTSNYATTRERQSTMGGIIRADLNWAFLPFLGIGAGGFASFNSMGSTVGLQFRVIAGKMGIRRKS